MTTPQKLQAMDRGSPSENSENHGNYTNNSVPNFFANRRLMTDCSDLIKMHTQGDINLIASPKEGYEETIIDLLKSNESSSKNKEDHELKKDRDYKEQSGE